MRHSWCTAGCGRFLRSGQTARVQALVLRASWIVCLQCLAELAAAVRHDRNVVMLVGASMFIDETDNTVYSRQGVVEDPDDIHIVYHGLGFEPNWSMMGMLDM